MMPRFQSWEKLKYFSEALVCFQHWLFKEQISRKTCLLKYLRYGCCRLSSLLLGEKGPQEAGLTPGNVGMCSWTPSSGSGKEQLGPDHAEAGLEFIRNGEKVKREG